MHNIKDHMGKKKQLRTANQTNELKIVFSPYAVIQPFAVMVKNFNTTVALPAVECIVRHTSLADIAEEPKLIHVEAMAFLDRLLVKKLDCIGGVDFGRYYPHCSCAYQEDSP